MTWPTSQSTWLIAISKRYEAGPYHRLPHFDPLTERLQRARMKRYGLEKRPLYLTNNTEFYAEIGRKGGASTKRLHGFEFYSRIGKVGGEAGKRESKG